MSGDVIVIRKRLGFFKNILPNIFIIFIRQKYGLKWKYSLLRVFHSLATKPIYSYILLNTVLLARKRIHLHVIYCFFFCSSNTTLL